MAIARFLTTLRIPPGSKAFKLTSACVAALTVAALTVTAVALFGGTAPAVAGRVAVKPPIVVKHKPPAPRVPPTNPLTGLGAPPRGPVVAVKLDDTAAGRPSMGLDKADVIYIEEAEGGLSRMVAVYASVKPQVEAVRSVRTSDPEVLDSYGKIIRVDSGGGGNALPTMDRANLRTSIRRHLVEGRQRCSDGFQGRCRQAPAAGYGRHVCRAGAQWCAGLRGCGSDAVELADPEVGRFG